MGSVSTAAMLLPCLRLAAPRHFHEVPRTNASGGSLAQLAVLKLLWREHRVPPKPRRVGDRKLLHLLELRLPECQGHDAHSL